MRRRGCAARSTASACRSCARSCCSRRCIAFTRRRRACWARCASASRRACGRSACRRRKAWSIRCAWLRIACAWRLCNCRCRPSRRVDRWMRSGTSSSAAAEGVGARRSAAKSARVKSVSWPTAETTGIGEAAIARTRASSLNAHRSSSEPPPRASSTTSYRPLAVARCSIVRICAAAASPCTGTGNSSISISGKRRRNTLTMSRITAPLGEVSTASRRTCAGRGRLRSASNRPSACSRDFSSSNARRNAPSPASSSESRISW